MGKGLLPEDCKVEGEHTRFYFVPEINDWVPSVTSILDKGFPKALGLMLWFKRNTEEHCKKISEEAMALGTEAHEIIERCIKMGVKGSPNFRILSAAEKEKIRGFIAWYKANDVTFLAQEQAVYICEEGIMAAGRFDALAIVNGVKMVLDWKRSKAIYESYAMQLSAYAKALGVEHCAVLRITDMTKKGYQFKAFNPEEHFFAFQAAFTLAKYNGIFKKKPDVPGEEK